MAVTDQILCPHVRSRSPNPLPTQHPIRQTPRLPRLHVSTAWRPPSSVGRGQTSSVRQLQPTTQGRHGFVLSDDSTNLHTHNSQGGSTRGGPDRLERAACPRRAWALHVVYEQNSVRCNCNPFSEIDTHPWHHEMLLPETTIWQSHHRRPCPQIQPALFPPPTKTPPLKP